MPLVFNNPESIVLDAAKIDSIIIRLEPELNVIVSYKAGPEQDGNVVPAKASSEAFNAAEYAAVDPDGALYAGVKQAAYELLETRLGAGQIT